LVTDEGRQKDFSKIMEYGPEKSLDRLVNQRPFESSTAGPDRSLDASFLLDGEAKLSSTSFREEKLRAAACTEPWFPIARAREKPRE
jgi:hypothetical protein